jgi:hypothetical protein
MAQTGPRLLGYFQTLVSSIYPYYHFLLTKVARFEEEELKLMTLFKSEYRPVRGTVFECAFGIIHPNLTFIFDDPVRGPNGMPSSFKITAHVLTEAQNTTTF